MYLMLKTSYHNINDISAPLLTRARVLQLLIIIFVRYLDVRTLLGFFVIILILRLFDSDFFRVWVFGIVFRRRILSFSGINGLGSIGLGGFGFGCIR